MISHYDLCELTAEKFLNKSRIVLYEYQSYATNEFPDVLCFQQGYTKLYEIKVSRQDFLKDNQKDCRKKYRVKYFPSVDHKKHRVKWESSWYKPVLQEFIQQVPHLGRERYYVCPKELIQPDEINNGWGLYWLHGTQLRMKKQSQAFKSNIYDELRILEHAFRKYACGNGVNVLINKYK